MKHRADGETAIVHQPMAAHALIPQQAGKQPNPTSAIARPPTATAQLDTYRDGSAGASAGIVTSDVFNQPCGVPFDCA